MPTLGEETAVQAVVGSIVWTFPRLKKPSCREMSGRGYALYSVRPQISFSFGIIRNITLLQSLRERLDNASSLAVDADWADDTSSGSESEADEVQVLDKETNTDAEFRARPRDGATVQASVRRSHTFSPTALRPDSQYRCKVSGHGQTDEKH